MNPSRDNYRASARAAAPPPSRAPSAALGTAAVFCGLVPVAAAIVSTVIMATEGEGHRSPPGTVVITFSDVVSLGLFFIGAPLGGISSLYFAWRNAQRHRRPDGIAFARGLTFYAVASTLLGWALCAGIMFYIMGSRQPR